MSLFYGDSGPDDHWPYESIQSYSISGGLVSIVGRRTLRMDGGDGISLRIRLGKRLAANADYILAAKGIQRH